MILSEYALCICFGFGSVFILSILFCLGCWMVGKMYKFYLDWRNPWRNLESFTNN